MICDRNSYVENDYFLSGLVAKCQVEKFIELKLRIDFTHI